MNIDFSKLDNDPEFQSYSPEEKTRFIEGAISGLPENMKGVALNEANRYMEYRTRLDGVGRAFNEDRVIQSVQSALPENFNDLDDEQKVIAIDQAKEIVEEKAAEIDPINKGDTGFHSRLLLSNEQRKILGKDVGDLQDKSNRFIGGVIQSFTAPISEEGTTEFLNRNLPTNPEYDTTAASKFTQAAGDFAGQIGQFAAIAALAGASGGTSLGLLGVRAGSLGSRVAMSVGLAQNASRKFQENYNLAKGEMGLSDDDAMEAGLAGMPGAVIDSFGDALLLRGIKLGSAGKSFVGMTAKEKAAEIVKKGASVLKDPKAMAMLTKNFAKGSLTEALSESLGDAATAWGGYATSGHEGFKPTASALWDSFWIGGILGGAASAALGTRGDLRNQRALKGLGSMDQESFMKMAEETQNSVAQLMDQGQYAEAARIINNFKNAQDNQKKQQELGDKFAAQATGQSAQQPTSTPATPEEEALQRVDADAQASFNAELDATMQQVNRPMDVAVDAEKAKLTNKVQQIGANESEFARLATSPIEGSELTVTQLIKTLTTRKQDGQDASQEEVPANQNQGGNVPETGKEGVSEAPQIPLAENQAAGTGSTVTPEVKADPELIQAFVAAKTAKQKLDAAKPLIALLVANDTIEIGEESYTLETNPSARGVAKVNGASMSLPDLIATADQPVIVEGKFSLGADSSPVSPDVTQTPTPEANVSPEPNVAQPEPKAQRKARARKQVADAAVNPEPITTAVTTDIAQDVADDISDIQNGDKSDSNAVKASTLTAEAQAALIEKLNTAETPQQISEVAKSLLDEGIITQAEYDQAVKDLKIKRKAPKVKKQVVKKTEEAQDNSLNEIKAAILRRIDNMEMLSGYKAGILPETGWKSQHGGVQALASQMRKRAESGDLMALSSLNDELDARADDQAIISKKDVADMLEKLSLIAQSPDQNKIDAANRISGQITGAQQDGRLFQKGQKILTVDQIDETTPEYQAMGPSAQALLKTLTPQEFQNVLQFLRDLQALGIDQTVSDADKQAAVEIERSLKAGEYAEGLNDKLNQLAPSRAIFQKSLLNLKGFGSYWKMVTMMQFDTMAINWLKTGGSIQSFYARFPEISVQTEFSGTYADGTRIFVARGELIAGRDRQDVRNIIAESGSSNLMPPSEDDVDSVRVDTRVRNTPFSPIPNKIILTSGHYRVDTLIHEMDHNLIVTGAFQQIIESEEGGVELYDSVLTELGMKRNQYWTIEAHEGFVAAREAWMRQQLPESNIFSRAFNMLKKFYMKLYGDSNLDRNRNITLEKAFEKIYTLESITNADVRSKTSKDIGPEAGMLLGHIPYVKLPVVQKAATAAKLISKSPESRAKYIRQELGSHKSQQKAGVSTNESKAFSEEEIEKVIAATNAVDGNLPESEANEQLGNKKFQEKSNYTTGRDYDQSREEDVTRLEAESAKSFIKKLASFFKSAYEMGKKEGEVYAESADQEYVSLAREYFAQSIKMGKSDLIYIINDIGLDENLADWMPDEIKNYSRFLMNIAYIGYDQVAEVLEKNPDAKIFDIMADKVVTNTDGVQRTGTNESFSGKVNESINTGLPRSARAINANELAASKIEDALFGLDLKTRTNKNEDEVYTADSKKKIIARLDALYPDGWVVKDSQGAAGSGIYTKTGSENAIVQNFSKSEIRKIEYIVESYDEGIANPRGQYRVHGYVRNGKVEIVPYATGNRFSKNPYMIRTRSVTTIEDAASAFAANMTELKDGDVFGFDVVQKQDGTLEVVEVNPTDQATEESYAGRSGYLDNPFYNIALASHIQGRTPAHVLIARIAARSAVSQSSPSQEITDKIEAIYQNFKDYASFAREMVKNFGSYVMDYVRAIWGNLVSNGGKLTSKSNGIVSAIEKADTQKSVEANTKPQTTGPLFQVSSQLPRQSTIDRFASQRGLFQYSNNTRQAETLRFNELTKDLYNGREAATQEEIDAWREANPEKWEELTKMKERIFLDNGWKIGHRAAAYKNYTPLLPSTTGGLGSAYYAVLGGNLEEIREFDTGLSGPDRNNAGMKFIADRMFIDLGPNPLFVNHPSEVKGKYYKDKLMMDSYQAWLKYQYTVNQAYETVFSGRPRKDWNARTRRIDESDGLPARRAGDLYLRTAESKKEYRDARIAEGYSEKDIERLRLNEDTIETNDAAKFNSFLFDRGIVSSIIVDWSAAKRIGLPAGDERMFTEVALEKPSQIKSSSPISAGRKITPDQWADDGRASILFQVGQQQDDSPVSNDALQQLGGMYHALARLNQRLGGASPINGKIMAKLDKAMVKINDALNREGGKAKAVTEKQKQDIRKLIRKSFIEAAENVSDTDYNRLIKDAQQYAFTGEALAGDSFNPSNNIRFSKDMSESEKVRYAAQKRVKAMTDIIRRDLTTSRLRNMIQSHIKSPFVNVSNRLYSLFSRGIDPVLSAFNTENIDLLNRFSDQIFLFDGKQPTTGNPQFIEDFLKTIDEVENEMVEHMIREFVAYNELYFVQEAGEYPEIDAILANFPRMENETSQQYFDRLNDMKQEIERIFNNVDTNEVNENGVELTPDEKKAKRRAKLREKREEVINKNQNDLKLRFPTFEDYIADKEQRHGGAHSEKFNQVMRQAYDWVNGLDTSTLTDDEMKIAHNLIVTMLTGGNHSAMVMPWVWNKRNQLLNSWKNMAQGLYDRVKDSRLVRPIFMGSDRDTMFSRAVNVIDRKIQANVENFTVWADRLTKYPQVRKWLDENFFSDFTSGAFIEAENAAKNSIDRRNEIVESYNDDLDNTANANPILWAVSNLIQFNIGSDPNKAFKINVAKARAAVDPAKVKSKANSSTSSIKEAQRNEAALNHLLDGIDMNADDAFEQFNRVVYDRMGYGNADLSAKRAQLLTDLQNLFTDGIADQVFVTEVLLQRRFITVANYLPMMTDRIDGSQDTMDITDMQADHPYTPSSAKYNQGANDQRKAASPDRILGLDLFKSVETKLFRNALDVHSRLPAYFLQNEIFRFKSKKDKDGVPAMIPASPLVREIWGAGPDVKGQIDAIREKINHQMTQIYRMTEPPNSIVSGIRTANGVIQSMMLSGMGQFFQQAGAALVDYSARESGNSQYLIDAALYWSKNYDKVRGWLQANYRDLAERGNTQGILENEKTFKDLGRELDGIDSLKEKMDTLRRYMTLSLRYGDKLGAELIFVAEHMKAVEQAGLIPDIRAYDIEDYTNPALTSRAANQLTRYIGPSSAAGRSWWMSDHKQAFSILRAVTGSFQSSAHNMSSQMLMAARNYRDLMKDGSNESKAEARAELRKIGSIMGQQATFTTLRHMFNGMLVLATVSAIRSAFDDEDDAIEKAQIALDKARTKNYKSKLEKERAVNEAERALSDAKAIRRAVVNMKQQASADAWFKGMVRDQVANLHIVNSFGDSFAPKMFMMPINSVMEQSFKTTNDATINALKKERSNMLRLNDKAKAAELTQKISDMEAIEYIPFFYEKKDKSGFGGIIGGVLDPIYSSYKEAVEDITREDKDFLTARAFVPDMLTYMSALGVGQADVSRVARQLQRMDDELSKNRLEEKERQARDAQELINKSGRTVKPTVNWQKSIQEMRR
jgi:hypothetical protein